MALHDVAADQLIAKTAVELKKILPAPPEWSMFAKTGISRERPPTNPDWWFVRAASLLRKVALVGPIGTEKLRRHYGGRKNLGHAPEHGFKGSGSVIRTILQELDKAGLTKTAEKHQRKGRVISPKGQALLYLLSDQITKEAGVAAKPAAPAKKQEAKVDKLAPIAPVSASTPSDG